MCECESVILYVSLFVSVLVSLCMCVCQSVSVNLSVYVCECESVSLCVSGGECIGAGAPTRGPWVALRVRPTISGAWRQGQDRAPEATGNRTAATEREKLPQPFCSQTASCPRPHPLVRLPSCGSSCPAPTPTPSAAQEPASSPLAPLRGCPPPPPAASHSLLRPPVTRQDHPQRDGADCAPRPTQHAAGPPGCLSTTHRAAPTAGQTD